MMKRIGYKTKNRLSEVEIGQLLDRYFDGFTTEGEEEQLRRYFATEDLPEEWQHLRPLFGYITCRRAIDGHSQSASHHSWIRRSGVRRTLWTVGSLSVAAAAALVLVFRQPQVDNSLPLPITNSYAVVNGVHVDDPELVRLYAQEAFDDVAIDRQELAQELFGL